MKLFAPFALAALAMTAGACTDTTTVYGSWRDGDAAGACHTGFFVTDAHVQIFDTDSGHIVANEEIDCDELGFALEVPLETMHVRVTATDPWGGHYDKELAVVDGFVDCGVIYFAQDTQPD